MADPWRSEEEREEFLSVKKVEINLKKKYKYAGDITKELTEHSDWSIESIIEFLNSIKDADVEEVKHGEWFPLEECANEGVYCTICRKKVYKLEYANQALKSKYCPNCGARMDKTKKGN